MYITVPYKYQHVLVYTELQISFNVIVKVCMRFPEATNTITYCGYSSVGMCRYICNYMNGKIRKKLQISTAISALCDLQPQQKYAFHLSHNGVAHEFYCVNANLICENLNPTNSICRSYVNGLSRYASFFTQK